MKLNELQWDAFSYSVQALSNELGINIYTMNNGFSNKVALQYGINWGAYGTQSAEDTLAFAKKLQEVAQLAQMLTSMEITYPYSEEGPEIDRDTFTKYCKAIIEMMKLGMPEMVVEVLNKMA